MLLLTKIINIFELVNLLLYYLELKKDYLIILLWNLK